MALDTMYPAVTNSPIATLTADIAIDATTIPVSNIEYFADATALAPGIATLQLGQTSESVTYTGKTGTSGAGTLTGCTRGADTTVVGGVTQGAASAWDSGTYAACMLTAKQIEAMRDNIIANDAAVTTHLDDTTAHTAAHITFAPSDTGLIATNVQAAIAELSKDIIVGFRIDTLSSTPALEWVDINKNVITGLNSTFFDSHPIWGRIRKCLIDANQCITYGSNARGDGLDLTVASGDVMVEFQQMYWGAEYDGSQYEYHWLSPYEYAGLPIHPWFSQRGGYVSKMYLGAYGACLLDDDGTLKLVSKTGEQPITGGEMWALAYTSGSTEFTIGETLTGATSGATGDVVTYHLSSGTWGAGDAAGTVYVKQHDYATTPYQAENLNGATAGDDCCTIAAAGSGLGFTIGDSESMANAKGSGWGSACWWGWHARMLLMYCEFGTRDLQTALGRGVVDLASGTGYAGKENGADSADTNIGVNGTGTGVGTDGQVSVVYRNIYDPYGGWWEFLTGWLAVDGGYQIVNRQGLASAVMPAGSFATADEYELSATAPITTDGYIKDYVRDALLIGLFMPSDTTGSSDTYACDYLYAHDVGETNILLGGGGWYAAASAGPGCLSASSVSSNSGRAVGARLEFKPQIE